jgi:alkylhydroperoxidase family enzyme
MMEESAMPVLEPVSDEAAAPEAKATFEAMQAKIKMVPNIFRTMAHAPDVLNATLAFDQSFHRGLDAKLRELAFLKTSLVNECHY